VTGFVKIIEADTLLSNNSRLSMITYNSSAKVILEGQIPASACLEYLNLNPTGGTDFNEPLIQAGRILNSYV